jgi:Zn-dependent protease with chaperone function
MILGSYLVIKEVETKSEFNVEVTSLDIVDQTEFVVLSHGDIEIHIEKDDFKKLGLKQGFFGKDQKPIMQGVMIACGVLMLLYYFYNPLMAHVASIVPDSIFDSTSKQLIEHYRPLHCINNDQEKNLEDVFARLGKNYSAHRVFVIKSSMVNAFVMPGNLIVIHDELLKVAPSPEAIAGIISHELAHIEGEHVKIALIKHYFMETISAFIMNQNVATGIIKQITTGLFTQEEERKADLIAASNLKGQHISPKGMVSFFEQLEKNEPSFLKFLSFTHPNYPDRIKVFSEVYDSYPVLSESAWKTLNAGCN